MDWIIASHQCSIPEAELADLHQKAVELLDLLQKNLPDKTGEKVGWNFEKAHRLEKLCCGAIQTTPRVKHQR